MSATLTIAWRTRPIATARAARRLLLRPETFAAMHVSVSVGKWGSPDLVYGLGLMCSVLHAAQPTPVCGHTGALVGYRTALWYAPGSRLTVAVALNQLLANPDVVASKVLDVLHAHSLG